MVFKLLMTLKSWGQDERSIAGILVISVIGDRTN